MTAMSPGAQSLLLEIYERLYSTLGPSGWWPGETPLEIIVGAILTQNTSWHNVEQALVRLKEQGGLSVESLTQIGEDRLAEMVRPAGTYRVKARRLKNFFRFLQEEYHGRIEALVELPLEKLRDQLLGVRGIGPETADSILLYALGRPTFVVDAYTYRIFSRHQLIPEESDYEGLRSFFMEALPEEVPLYNEFHALIVRTGKAYCRKKAPLCGGCPLWELERDV
jgi:endonuclease III related protein